MIYHINGQHWSLPGIHFSPETYQKGRLEIDRLCEKTLVSRFVFLRSALVTATLKDCGTYCCSRLINYCNHRVLWYLLRSSEFNLVKALQINVSCKLHCMRKWWVQYNSGSGSVWLCYCEGMESFLYFPLLMMSCYFQSSFYFYFFELRG